MSHKPIGLTRLAAGRLEEEGVENARLDAELLLAHVLGLERLDLYLQHDRPLTEAEVAAYRSVVRRRLRREPLQYITGVASFRQLELKVDGRALIPRPETEVLVGAVLEWAGSLREPTDDRRPTPDAGSLRQLTAVDLGTGTGAIALSLAQEGGFARVVATDRSAEALALAAENVERLGLGDRVTLRCGDLWAVVEPGERFDVVVSNPPYVAASERETLMPEVGEWEPAEALLAGEDGRAVVDAIVRGAADRLVPGGLLALEVGLGQAESVAALAARTPGLERPRIVEDLTGRGRIVLAHGSADIDRKTGAS